MSNATSNDQKPDVVPFVLNIDPVGERVTTVFPAGATILGDGSLHLKEGGRIGGVIKGNVFSDSGTLVIDQNAIIEGNVTAKGRCIVFGQVGTPNRRTTLRCEKADGLLISHIAQIHADVSHNGLATTNVSGQIQRIGEAPNQTEEQQARRDGAAWQPPGQQPEASAAAQPVVPPQLEHNPSPIANFGNTVTPLRVVMPAPAHEQPRSYEAPQQSVGQQHGQFATGNGQHYPS
jgi:hypothetical protein